MSGGGGHTKYVGEETAEVGVGSHKVGHGHTTLMAEDLGQPQGHIGV